ncbi:hypothetical protein DEJ49_18765 [Streptomyces venezuelae]|uniref:Gram-positive cocci surface proteins LPxTG domain-containing protein n=1 Tax=Streptomyces venezuelae TaxID=54571 RepID=A0A5P2CM14_STRVZ|nr:hypothetical protein [Streptomyces venezuelae]QES42758.1 hypothetical protein DEJ49_18765 [Streptomyces venezuelae]
MRATRRTFRTAAIATGAIAALAVPTTAAFAADAPSTPQGQVAQDDQQGTQDQTGKDENQKQDENNQDKSKDDQNQTDKDQTDKDQTGKDKEQPPVPGGWESKGTTDLGKGWTASVEVNASARTAKATISLNGAAKGSLTAYEKSASTTIDGNTFTLTPDGTATAKLTDKNKDKDKKDPVVGGWESKGTTNLGKGWTAKVDVNASARTAKAAISLNGKPKGSLTAYATSATTRIDGNIFTLTPSGTVTMKAKPTPPKPRPDHKRVFVREYKNLGGSGFDAKVYKVKNGYEADMIAKLPDTGKKSVWDTLKQTGNKPAYGQHNGAHFVLNPDGTMKGWTEGKTKGNGNNTGHRTNNGTKPQPHPRNDSQQVVPKGGVKAGADGVQSESSSDDAPLIAAGGGMAAAGAAGLGFALYRRKQNG